MTSSEEDFFTDGWKADLLVVTQYGAAVHHPDCHQIWVGTPGSRRLGRGLKALITHGEARWLIEHGDYERCVTCAPSVVAATATEISRERLFDDQKPVGVCRD